MRGVKGAAVLVLAGLSAAVLPAQAVEAVPPPCAATTTVAMSACEAGAPAAQAAGTPGAASAAPGWTLLVLSAAAIGLYVALRRPSR